MPNEQEVSYMTWQSLGATAGIGGLSVLATLIVTWLRSKTLKWGKRINNPIIERLNEQLDVWIDDSINTVNKNFVDKLKEIGEWDMTGGEIRRAADGTVSIIGGVFDKNTYKNNAKEALERCLASLKSRIPKPFKKLVIKYYDDVDLFYKNRIDERIKEHELERLLKLKSREVEAPPSPEVQPQEPPPQSSYPNESVTAVLPAESKPDNIAHPPIQPTSTYY